MSFINSLISAPADKVAAPTTGDQVRGFTFVPRHEVTETADAFGLVVQLPGVAKDGLEISVDHEQVRIVGRRAWRKPESWTTLHCEIAEADYELTLAHERAVDADKVHAELRDGVLRVSLPKTEALKPRKIAVA